MNRCALSAEKARHLGDQLVLCPVTCIELAPAFRGEHRLQQAFLQQVGVNWREAWHWQDTEAAHWLWADHVAHKRAGYAGKRPVADVFIEAFALRFQGLITRNPKHFTAVPTIVP